MKLGYFLWELFTVMLRRVIDFNFTGGILCWSNVSVHIYEIHLHYFMVPYKILKSMRFFSKIYGKREHGQNILMLILFMMYTIT